MCSATVVVPTECGEASNQSHYSGDLTAGSPTLCATGLSTDAFALQQNNIFTRSCGDGASTGSCSAFERIDGLCGTTIGEPVTQQPTIGTLCDSGNSTSFSLSAS